MFRDRLPLFTLCRQLAVGRASNLGVESGVRGRDRGLEFELAGIACGEREDRGLDDARGSAVAA